MTRADETTSLVTSPSRAIHYWTGRGTLCSLDNSVTMKDTHSSRREDVTCRYCLNQLSLNAARRTP